MKLPAFRTLGAGVATVALTFGVVACGNSGDDTAATSAANSADASAEPTTTSAEETAAAFPRTVSTLDGEGNATEINLEAQPKNIVSTSVTLTGHLLALEAPVSAIGVQGKSNTFADDKGFFNQWADEANAAGVEVAYEGEPDVEAILAQAPDLVVMSLSGQDSAVDVYDQLADVVPVVVVDYSDKDWDEVLVELGLATGLEDKVDEAVDNYNNRLAEVAAAIDAPEQPVNIISLGQGGQIINVWTGESAQGRLLTDLGWELALPDENSRGGDPRFDGRNDVISVGAENFAPGLTGKTIAGINSDPKQTPSEVLAGIPQLADNAAVKEGRVYDFPAEFFRVDYFSALLTLDYIEETFAK